VGSGLRGKHYKRLEKLTRDKCSNLFGPFVSYDGNFFNTVSGAFLGKGWPYSKLTNITQGWKGLTAANTLTYLAYL
jgi:hypothetical protein